MSSRMGGASQRTRLCKRCKFSTTDGKEFLHHQMTAHSTESIEVYACEKCDYISSAYNDLIQHKRSVHPLPLAPGNVQYSKAQNDGTTNENSAAKSGSWSSNSKQEPSMVDAKDELQVYECEQCDFVTEYESDLFKHKACHHSPEQGVHSPESYMEGVSEDVLHDDSNDDEALYYRQDQERHEAIVIEPESESDYKAPLQIVMELSKAEKEKESRSLLSKAGNSRLMDEVGKRMLDERLAGRLPGGRPRCTPVREAVDPAKYMTIQEGDGVKYACSKCGNIYKWRKSLNKHWKEKHEGEVPDPKGVVPPQFGSALSPHKSPFDKANSYGSKSSRENSLFSHSNQAVANGPQFPGFLQGGPRFGMPPYNFPFSVASTQPIATSSGMVMNNTWATRPPNMISALQKPFQAPLSFEGKHFRGEFLHGNSHGLPPPAAHVARNFAGMTPPTIKPSGKGLQLYHFDDQEEVLDLSRKVPRDTSYADGVESPASQDTPLDFSGPSPVSETKKIEETPQNTMQHQEVVPKYHCTMCEFHTEQATLLEQHMELHNPTDYSYRCAECDEAFPVIEELNEHFTGSHFEVLQRKLSVCTEAPPAALVALLRAPPARRRAAAALGVVQENTCVVCGAHFTWQDALATHFTQEHADLPNPYQVTIDDPDDHKSDTADASEAPTERNDGGGDFKLLSPDGNPIDFEEENTAIVIPLAPEDNAANTPRKKHKGVGGRVHVAPSPSQQPADGDSPLPYKCAVCDYRARWPSEITQHMKNHSDEKPYHCPRCSYRSKWKWDVVKHLKRCGGGTVNDVIDTTAAGGLAGAAGGKKSHDSPSKPGGGGGSVSRRELSSGPPNVTVNSCFNTSTSSQDDMEESEENCDDAAPNHQQSDHTVSPPGSAGAGTFSCAQCSFTATSSAELKRHARVHVDDKPFICRTCGYSSRWKCDLKKHLRTYGHTSAVPLIYGGHGRKPAKNDPVMVMMTAAGDDGRKGGSGGGLMHSDCDADDEVEESVGKTAPVELGAKAEVQTVIGSGKDNNVRKSAGVGKLEKSPVGKYKCKMCAYATDDLPTFVQHKLNHSAAKEGDARAKMDALSAQELDKSATNKHRRKPVKTKKSFSNSDWQQEESNDKNNDVANGSKNVSANKADENVMEDEQSSVFSDDADVTEPEHAKENKHAEGETDADAVKNSSVRVMQVHKENRTMFACKSCPFHSENIINIANHSRQHGTNRKFTCEFCDYSLQQWPHIVKHMRTVHGKASADAADNDSGDGNNDTAVVGEAPTAENEWEIKEVNKADVEEADESPTKRRKLSSTNSVLLEYACAACGFTTTSKTAVTRHKHEEKTQQATTALDINSNNTNGEISSKAAE